MIAGVALALCSGLLFASGNLAQKRGVDSLRRFTFHRPISTLASLLTSRIWILGAVLSIAGVGTQLAAYRYVSIAIVQSVGGVGIVALLVVPRVLLGERPARHEILGALVALVAFGLVVASVANQSQINRSRGMTSRTEVAMLAMSGFATIVLVIGMRAGRSGAALYGFSAGVLYGAMGIGLKGASNAFLSARVTSAIGRLLAGPIPYSVLAAWIAALLVFQIGIQRSKLSIVAPTSSVISMVAVITVGTPLFGESWPSSALYFSLRLLGVLAIFIALALALTPPRAGRPGVSKTQKQPAHRLARNVQQPVAAIGTNAHNTIDRTKTPNG